jgi:hypothetical protein
MASLVEVKELHSELIYKGQPNTATALIQHIFDRAERVTTQRYAVRGNPNTPPHQG